MIIFSFNAYEPDVGKIQGQSRVSRRVSRGAVEGQPRMQPCAISSLCFLKCKESLQSSRHCVRLPRRRHAYEVARNESLQQSR